jgi:hypothetical protein
LYDFHQRFLISGHLDGAWVRVASSVRISAVNRLEIEKALRHVRTLEAMRTQALFIVSARPDAT